MTYNSGRSRNLASYSRVWTCSILLFTLSACAQATQDVTVTEPPPATLSPTIEPTSLPPTSTAIIPSPTSPPLPESNLSFEAFAVPEGEVIALVNGRVIDGTGAPAWLNWTVLIQGTDIIEAGPNVVIPEGARRVDLTGQTLLPGLFDMHGHLYSYNGEKLKAEFITYPRLYLAGGVTTLFTAGDFDPRGAISLREKIRNNEAVGPQILTAGPYFSGGSAPSWMLTARTPEEMRALYEVWNDQIDGVKTYTRIPEDQFVALLEAAHADGLKVTGHLESISGLRAIELGIDGIEHGLFSMSEFFPNLPQSVSFRAQYCAISQLDMTSSEVTVIVDALVNKGIYIDPTIVVFQPELPDFVPLVADWEKYLDPGAVMPLRRALRSIIEPTCLPTALEKQSQFVKAVHDRGGLIVTGTDPVLPILLPGYSLHRELQNLVNAGLSPLEAIKAATLNAAIATGLDSQKGTIAAGKIADLVIVTGNPDEDITAIGNTVLVFKEGMPYLPEALRKSVEGQIGKDD
ncbi:MAG TPA: amidohydrolase family protein [Anaerolineales bacterium]|nr:amidohydrolase family protein [Anaerolineales bacterium]